MKDNLIERIFNRSSIHQRIEDGYINLNQMADATGRRIDNWQRLQSTQELIAAFEAQQEGVPSDLSERSPALVTIRGGTGGGGGTWAHPDIAIQFAQWCNPAFALQVSKWVREWMVSGRSPLADIDRMGLRSTLKDDSRVRMTDQVKEHLERIQKYDNKKYCGFYFSQVHDSINVLITGETSKQMRERLSVLLNRKVKQDELIRDYFPSEVLNRYISMCEASANIMINDEIAPLEAVQRASRIVLYAGYVPTPINFVEHIKFVRQRLTTGQGGLQLPG